MSVLKLVIAPDPILEQISSPVDMIDSQITAQLEAMKQLMYDSGGIGLAAVQAGLLKRMMIVHVVGIDEWNYSDTSHLSDYSLDGGPFCIINPEITETSNTLVSAPEGCLSVPGQKYHVIRPDAIILNYLDQDGKQCVLKAAGWLGRCIQHELDHLNGKLFISRLSRIKYAMAKKKAIAIKKEKNLP